MTEAPEGSADPVTAALAHVMRDYGRRITTDPVRLRAALNDVLGPTAQQHRAAVDALVVSAQEGIPSTLDEGGADSSADAAARLAEWGLDQPTAAWVAGAWLAVLPGHSPVPGAPRVPPPPTAAPPTSTPPTLAPSGAAQPPTAQPPTVVPAIVQPPTHRAADAAAPSLLSRAARNRGLTAAAAAALLLVVASTAYAMTSGKGQPLAGPSGTPTPSLTSSGTSLLTTPGTGQSSDLSTPSPSVSVSVQATILTTTSPAGTKQPAATRTPVRTPTVKPTRKPTPKPAPRPIASTTGVVYSVAQQTNSSIWNSTVWHASIAPYIKNPWTRMTYVKYFVYSPNRRGYVTNTLWAQVQKYGTDGFAWHPLGNGPMIIYIHFYVYNSAGVQSNEGMLTVNIACQTSATIGCST